MAVTSRAYATLTVYSRDAEVFGRVSNLLLIHPTRVSETNGLYGWFYSTQGRISSSKLEDHIKSILNLFAVHRADLEGLRKLGCDTRIWCFWESCSRNSGLVLAPETLSGIGSLGLELHFDVWLLSK
jgi:hypothetical protein